MWFNGSQTRLCCSAATNGAMENRRSEFLRKGLTVYVRKYALVFVLY